MEQLGPPVDPSSLAKAFAKCCNEFLELYLALTKEDCTYRQEVSLPRIVDEYGRLGVWGSNVGGDHTGRGSLDDRVRNDPSLHSLIEDLLEDLYNDLARGISLSVAIQRLVSGLNKV